MGFSLDRAVLSVLTMMKALPSEPLVMKNMNLSRRNDYDWFANGKLG